MKRTGWLAVGGAVAGGAGLLALNTWVIHAGVVTDASCEANADGSIFCTFTNRGPLPGTVCASALLLREADAYPLVSDRVCSGALLPGAVRSVTQEHAYPGGSPIGHCLGKDLRRCSVTWTVHR